MLKIWDTFFLTEVGFMLKKNIYTRTGHVITLFFPLFFFCALHHKSTPSASFPDIERVYPSGTDRSSKATARLPFFFFFFPNENNKVSQFSEHCNRHQIDLSLTVALGKPS